MPTEPKFPVDDLEVVRGIPGWDQMVNDALSNLAFDWITTPECSHGWAGCDLYAAALKNARANGREEPAPLDKVIALVFVLSGELELMGECEKWGG